jgi:ABC-type Fe3+ transport system permease subunit
MPSSLIGIGLIGVFNGTVLYNTTIMPILASVIRFLPLGSIFCYGGFKSLNKEVILARHIFVNGLQLPERLHRVPGCF